MLPVCAGQTGGLGIQRHTVLLLAVLATHLPAQELQPRAYIPAPVGLNYFGFGYSNDFRVGANKPTPKRRIQGRRGCTSSAAFLVRL